MKRRALVFVFWLFATPALASDSDTIHRLRTDLLGQQSATQVLTHWCADLGLATPAVIKAVRVQGVEKPADAAIRRQLGAAADEPIRYRKVRLMCGRHVLSQADNWYRPGKLTAAMNRQLDGSEAPFGAVVRGLNFHRQSLAVHERPSAGVILRIKAVLRNPAGTPFSLVVEDYQSNLLARR
jgi:chorismate-pyruvate lyase